MKARALGVAAVVVLWALVALLFFEAQTEISALYDTQVAAAEAMQACLEEMARVRAPLQMRDDLNSSGLIGLPFSDMTTTLGSLESKRTAATPDAAAMVVRLVSDMRLDKEARIAVNMSGSFPGLNIAALCAIEAMGYEAVAIASLGASTYGANDPQWHYLRIHAHLQAQGLLQTPLRAASVGGGRDIGAGMPGEGMAQALREDILASGVPLIEKPDFEENILARMAAFGQVNAYINIGGNWTGGMSPGLETLPVGVIHQGAVALPDGVDGLLVRYLSEEKPVLQLLNMKGLCALTGLPFDPSPLPEIGQSAVYRVSTPNRWLAGGLLVLSIGVLLFIKYGRKMSNMVNK